MNTVQTKKTVLFTLDHTHQHDWRFEQSLVRLIPPHWKRLELHLLASQEIIESGGVSLGAYCDIVREPKQLGELFYVMRSGTKLLLPVLPETNVGLPEMFSINQTIQHHVLDTIADFLDDAVRLLEWGNGRYGCNEFFAGYKPLISAAFLETTKLSEPNYEYEFRFDGNVSVSWMESEVVLNTPDDILNGLQALGLHEELTLS